MQAGKVDSRHSAYVLDEPGQPLYLQYRPAPLLRGKPADSVAWQVVDKWGKSAPASRIDIHIECNPGYFFEESSPSFCAPCPAGNYNFPDARDQVRKTAYLLSCGVTKYTIFLAVGILIRRLLTPSYRTHTLVLQMLCIPCPAGTFCSAPGLTTFEECPPGSFQVICS